MNPPTATLVGDQAALESANFVDDRADRHQRHLDRRSCAAWLCRRRPARCCLQQGQTVTVTIRVTTLSVNQTIRVPPSVINLSGAVQLAHPLDLVSVTISGRRRHCRRWR